MLKNIIFIVYFIISFTPISVFAFCFEDAGRLYNISPEILKVISNAESNYKPYAINYNKNGSYDYCHMQINSTHARKLGLEAWNLLSDPCYCTKVGAWVLASCMAQYGYSWEAIGCYNAGSSSNNKSKRYDYALKIFNKLREVENGHN